MRRGHRNGQRLRPLMQFRITRPSTESPSPLGPFREETDKRGVRRVAQLAPLPSLHSPLPSIHATCPLPPQILTGRASAPRPQQAQPRGRDLADLETLPAANILVPKVDDNSNAVLDAEGRPEYLAESVALRPIVSFFKAETDVVFNADLGAAHTTVGADDRRRYFHVRRELLASSSTTAGLASRACGCARAARPAGSEPRRRRRTPSPLAAITACYPGSSSAAAPERRITSRRCHVICTDRGIVP